MASMLRVVVGTLQGKGTPPLIQTPARSEKPPLPKSQLALRSCVHHPCIDPATAAAAAAAAAVLVAAAFKNSGC